MGWYHSHPGYGCWLSGIDVSTQMMQQRFQDPFLAIVVDPHRTIAVGKVEIGAFRTYPEARLRHASRWAQSLHLCTPAAHAAPQPCCAACTPARLSRATAPGHGHGTVNLGAIRAYPMHACAMHPGRQQYRRARGCQQIVVRATSGAHDGQPGLPHVCEAWLSELRAWQLQGRRGCGSGGAQPEHVVTAAAASLDMHACLALVMASWCMPAGARRPSMPQSP